jgi:hypothetical protein
MGPFLDDDDDDGDGDGDDDDDENEATNRRSCPTARRSALSRAVQSLCTAIHPGLLTP